MCNKQPQNLSVTEKRAFLQLARRWMKRKSIKGGWSPLGGSSGLGKTHHATAAQRGTDTGLTWPGWARGLGWGGSAPQICRPPPGTGGQSQAHFPHSDIESSRSKPIFLVQQAPPASQWPRAVTAEPASKGREAALTHGGCRAGRGIPISGQFTRPRVFTHNQFRNYEE